MSSNFQEIECKFLGVNPDKIAKELEKIGAVREYKRLFKRYVFDFPDRRLDSQKSWLRVRDEGDKATLTYKQRLAGEISTKDNGMKEIEITVGDFEHAAEILRAIGMEPKFYEENWRTLYKLDDIEFAIDEWPLIPPYLEIESDSWEKVDQMATKLGFNMADKFVCSTMQVYEHYKINENDYTVLTHDKQIKAV